ncbi:MAG TPA: Gfo/Idh/MocA family oxidoreductase, partial [Gemmatimonadaceae bacterium]|nr:Gfo/Idh/MocA family oxidoreductase [Gemmatimonadaceae bacterium]
RSTQIIVDEGGSLHGDGAETIEVPAIDQYALQADHFANAIRGVGTVAVSIEDAIANMAVIDALFRSGDTRRWEKVAS